MSSANSFPLDFLCRGDFLCGEGTTLTVQSSRFRSGQPVSSPSISTSGMAAHNESSQSPLPPASSGTPGSAATTTTTAAATAATDNPTPMTVEVEAPSTSKAAPVAQTNGDSSHPAPAALDDDNEQKLQSKLSESTEMIETLTKLQKERLSKAPPNNLGNVPGPSPTELRLGKNSTNCR